MVLGEHAVLHGYPALVCAMNGRVEATLTPREDRLVILRSALGTTTDALDTLTPGPPHRYALEAVRLERERLPGGLEIAFTSTFSHQVGLGSSAAVTTATLAALDAWLGHACEASERIRRGVAVVRAVQGMGSGADIAASTLGGLVAYRAAPLEAEPIGHAPEWTVVYSGHKTPTPEVIRRVEALRMRQPRIVEGLYGSIGLCAEEGARAARLADWPTLGESMNANQRLMEKLGVCDDALTDIVRRLNAAPGILGAKISGSGLGDCAIGLGQTQESFAPYARLPYRPDPRGVMVGRLDG